jgi:energy-coupling factor transporter ATP-binding protein EcfA2
VTLYNPHLLPRQDLIETFVARQPLLDELFDDLRRGGGQHHLLVGNRGSGKTTLLLRLATAIEDDQKLAKKCIPLRFPEEQYNVSRPSDFWMNAIDALVDALERQDDRTAATRLESSLAELEHLEEPERAKRSFTILATWAKQARRSIVLLIDNLDLILDRLADSLWDLREALSIDNRLIVIGASSKFIEEAIEYQSPFYDFFHIHEFAPLSEEEARSIVLSLARRANTPQVAEVLERDPGRFKALYVLTGGTPRTLALLHTVLALDHSDRIERDLDGLLDQLTPYYKARFDDLPSQSQVIVDKVALHWHPITAAECQAATHLDLNTVSAQLSRLVKSGLLTKVSLPGPNKLGFQLSERFFNIWYLMRASRRLRRRLSWFVEFLRIFYGEEDLRRRAEELVRATPSAALDSPAKLLAFASAVPDEALRRRLEFRAIGLLMKEGVAAIREVMDLEGEDVHLVPVIDRVRALQDIRARLARASVRWPPGQTSSSVAEMISRHPSYPIPWKQKVSRLLEKGHTDHFEVLQSTLERASINLGDRLLNAISSGEVPSLPDVKTPLEIQQIIELAKSRWHAITWIVGNTEGLGLPLSDEVIQHMLRLDPLATEAIMIAALSLVPVRSWARIRHLVLLASRPSSAPIQIEQLVAFLRECIAENRAAEALELLVEAGLAERWAPLYEALRAVADGSKARLDGLAPEMRVAALELYEQLCGPDVLQAHGRAGDVASARPEKSPATKRRAASPETDGRTIQGRRGQPARRSPR